nr:PREDICTED: complement C1s-B subcomponent-like [Lepisosteus oculatus]
MGPLTTDIWLLCVSQCLAVALSGSSPVLYGEVQSPGYPNPYPASLNEVWDLAVPQGFALQLTFRYLDIEPSQDCYYDSLTVMSGKKVLGRFCGQNSADEHHPGNSPILSPSNHLRLIFQSDSSSPGPHQHIGFKAFYQAIDVDDCASPLQEGEEPLCQHYCHNILGGYLCSCRHGYELQPNNRTCQYKTYEVSIPGHADLLLCGSEAPAPIVSSSNEVRLEYHTDQRGDSRGWRLEYTTERVQCPSPRSISHGRVTPQFTEYRFRDYIRVKCDTGYKLMMGEKEIGGYFSMCKSDGQWHLPLPECRIIDCGTPSNLLNGGVQFLSGSLNQYQSVIQYHCSAPYYVLERGVSDVYRCEAQGYWRSLNDSLDLPKCVAVCGEPESKHSDFGRIFGGREAEPGQIPWQVYVNDPKGGGSLISDRWVLTAAHVVEGKDSLLMYGGTADIENIESSKNAVTLQSQKIFIHPGYLEDPKSGKHINYDNDIALVKLKSRVPLGPHLLPICLPERKDDGTLISERLGFVSGWGRTEHGTLSSKLLYVEIPVKDRDTCSKNKDGKPLEQMFTENMFCAGEKGKDSCHGDSGGPFFLREFRRGAGGQIERGPFRLYGVVSWGLYCRERGYYTKVDNYLGWIRETMEREERHSGE